MKTIQYKAMALMTLAIVLLSGCTKDSDVDYPLAPTTLLAEDFNNADLTVTGWKKYAEIGTKNWTQEVFSGDGYAQFNSFDGGTEPISVGWLISPPINMDTQTGEKLAFVNCQDGFVRNIDNTFELFVSTDFDGTNVSAASWERIPFNVANQNTERFLYINSGIIDLSEYTGTLYFAFKVRGTSSLTGGYQVDKVRLFY